MLSSLPSVLLALFLVGTPARLMRSPGQSGLLVRAQGTASPSVEAGENSTSDQQDEVYSSYVSMMNSMQSVEDKVATQTSYSFIDAPAPTSDNSEQPQATSSSSPSQPWAFKSFSTPEAYWPGPSQVALTSSASTSSSTPEPSQTSSASSTSNEAVNQTTAIPASSVPLSESRSHAGLAIGLGVGLGGGLLLCILVGAGYIYKQRRNYRASFRRRTSTLAQQMAEAHA